MDAFKRRALILRGALQVGGERGARLAQALGGIFKRDLRGVFHVDHARANLIGADGGWR